MMRIRQLSIALALALSAAEAGALGFGEIEVNSRLNEPLDARIRIASADEEELATLSVRLAGAEDFARMGLRRQAVPVALEFAVERDREGRPVVRVRSRQPVREPLLPLLIEAEWSKGRMFREFVVLLDPPLTVPAVVKAPARPARVAEPPAPARRETIAAAADEPPRVQPEAPAPLAPARAEPPPRTEEPIAAPAPAPAEREPPARAEEPLAAPTPAREAEAPAPVFRGGGEYGPVAAGETLWQIALATRPAEAEVQQMLVAIFEANPGAFIDGNVNLLRRGAVLRIPGAEEVRAIDRAEARRRLAEHSEAWLARRGMAAPARVAAPSEPPPVLAGREERRATPREERPRREDRLAILPPAGEETRPRVGAGGGAPARDAEVEGLRADLQRSRESLAAAEQELGELRSRVRELEAIESDQQRLIALKDSELANLRQRLAELEERLRLAETSGPTTPPAEPREATAPPAAPIEPTEAAPPSPAPTVAAAPPAEPAPSPSPAQPPAAAPAPADAEATPWYLRPPVLGGGVAVLLLVLALVWLGRRRRGAETGGEKSLASRLVAAAPPQQAQSEERLNELKAAVEADPTDLQAHLALLRFLYNREDQVAFEIAAESMAGYVGEGASPEWDEVLTMGREIAPEHPLFRRAPEAPVAARSADALPPAPAAPTDLSFPLPPEEPPRPLASDQAPASALPELKLPAWEPEPEERPAEPVAETPAPADFDDALITQRLQRSQLDLAKEWDTQRISQADVERAMADRSPAASGVSLGESEDDVVATKLDLAREYLDLGDAEGARGLLEEVLSEGSPAQKAEAQRLLAQIR